MTFDEFNQTLQKYQHTVEIDNDLNQYLIYDPDHQLVAKINYQKRNKLKITNQINYKVLHDGVIHFAGTPLAERHSDHQIDIQLTQAEIDALDQLPTKFDRDQLTLSNLQMHALRHLKRQLNQHLNQNDLEAEIKSAQLNQD